MKSLLMIAVLFASSTGLAVRDDDWAVGGPQVRYISWCSRNVVMTDDARGNDVVKFDCSVQGLECKQLQTRQGPYVFVSAACAPRTYSNPRSR